MNVPVVCCVGTTDPWNAAGLGLDALAVAACGGFAVTVTAGVTAQGPRGVAMAHALSPELVVAQFDALADAGIAAYRVGALLDAATVAIVAERLARVRLPVVYDPALGASGGGRFGDDATRAAIVARLLPAVSIVMPNLAEAGALANVDAYDRATMRDAATALVARGAAAALVTGGHLAGDAIVDVLVDAQGTHAYEAARLAGALRGTGCLLAASLAVALSRGVPLRDAIDEARAFVRARFATARERGGMRVAF